MDSTEVKASGLTAAGLKGDAAHMTKTYPGGTKGQILAIRTQQDMYRDISMWLQLAAAKWAAAAKERERERPA